MGNVFLIPVTSLQHQRCVVLNKLVSEYAREANVFFGVLRASMEDNKTADKTAGQRDVSATLFDPLLHEFDDIFQAPALPAK